MTKRISKEDRTIVLERIEQVWSRSTTSTLEQVVKAIYQSTVYLISPDAIVLKEINLKTNEIKALTGRKIIDTISPEKLAEYRKLILPEPKLIPQDKNPAQKS